MAKKIQSVEGVRLVDKFREDAIPDLESVRHAALSNFGYRSIMGRGLSVFGFFETVMKNKLSNLINLDGCATESQFKEVVEAVHIFSTQFLKESDEYGTLMKQAQDTFNDAVDSAEGPGKRGRAVNPDLAKKDKAFSAELTSDEQAKLLELVEDDFHTLGTLANSLNLAKLVGLINGLRLECHHCLNRECKYRDPKAQIKSTPKPKILRSK